MKIGLFIADARSLGDLVAQTQQAEADGFASAWFPNAFGLDAMTAAAVAGAATSQIEVGTAVVPTYLRHPVAMAQQALSTQVASGGRFTLGIGLSHQIVIETMLGLSFAKPFTHMQEYMAVVAPLIRSGSVSYAGSEYRVTANLTVAEATPCPILLAALAPKMLALAASVGDGTITWMTGLKTLRAYTIPHLTEAAAKTARAAPRVVAGLPIAVTSDAAGAHARAAKRFRMYGSLPSYRAMLDREGVEGPADVAIVGDENAVGEQLQRLAEMGVTDFLAAPFPVGSDAPASLERTRALLLEVSKR